MPISILRSFIQQILPHSSLTQVNTQTNKQTIDPIHSLLRCRSPSMIRMIDCSPMLCNCIHYDRHTRRHLSFLFVSHSSTPSHRLDTVRVRHSSLSLRRRRQARSRHRRSFDPRLFITLSRRVRSLLRRRSSIFSVRRAPISRWSTRSPRSSARSVRRWRRNVDLGRWRSWSIGVRVSIIIFHSIWRWTNVRRHHRTCCSLRKRNGFELNLLALWMSFLFSSQQ